MNLLDSSGWIEFFANGPNADRFAAVAVATAELLVPTIVLHEVYRWAERAGGDLAANRAVVAMQAASVVPLDAGLAIAAARLARRHRLPTADGRQHHLRDRPGPRGDRLDSGQQLRGTAGGPLLPQVQA